MADLNALIAQGAQFRQPTDPFAQYAQMQQLTQGVQANQLNQMKLQEMQRSLQEQEGMRNYLKVTPNFDPTNPTYQTGLMQVAPTTAPKLLESFLTTRKTVADIGKSTAETGELAAKTLDANLANFNKFYSPISAAAAGPQGVQDYMTALYGDPILGSVAARMKPLDVAVKENLAAYQADPKNWVAAHSNINGEQILNTLKGTLQTTNLGGTSQQQTIDAYGRPVAGTQVSMTMTPTPGEISTARTAATQGAANRANAMEIATLPTFNEAAGGFTGRPTAANPSGSFTPLPAVALNKDVAASAKVLKAIGYDPAAKTDKVSELIKQSTSGGLQAATTGGLGMVGISTSGAKAIGSLEALASSLNLDMLGGRLGAGISDADTAMIRQGLADIANPRIPAPTRLAAWNTVVEKLSQRTEGGTISSLGSGTAAPAGTSVTTPDGQVHTFPSVQAAAAFKKAVGQ